MRTSLCAASMTIFLVGVLLPSVTSAAPGGCVDLLTDCAPNSSVLTTVCGNGFHDLTPLGAGVTENVSFVVFGPGVQSATLFHCGTGATITITQSTNVCDLGDTWNDNVCVVSLTIPTAAPAISGVVLTVLSALLFAGGIAVLRRRRTVAGAASR